MGVLLSGTVSHIPLFSAGLHPSYGDCLKVKREYYQNCSVLDCVTQCPQSAAYLYEQFLQVQHQDWVCRYIETLYTLCIELVVYSCIRPIVTRWSGSGGIQAWSHKIGHPGLLYWVLGYHRSKSYMCIIYMHVIMIYLIYQITKFTSQMHLTWMHKLAHSPPVWPNFRGHRSQHVKIQFWDNQDGTHRNRWDRDL